MPKTRGFFATIGCLILLCTSCATQKVVKKSHDLEAQGDYKGAYTNIVEGLRASPKSEKLLTQKARISELYAQDLLRSASRLPTNDLPEKIQLLQSASQLECGGHDEITKTLSLIGSVVYDLLKAIF
jgi:hypothetical protein